MLCYTPTQKHLNSWGRRSVPEEPRAKPQCQLSATAEQPKGWRRGVVPLGSYISIHAYTFDYYAFERILVVSYVEHF
eukprot:scaffold92116_cov16-Prasinocladus_malaysianus.AAC.1